MIGVPDNGVVYGEPTELKWKYSADGEDYIFDFEPGKSKDHYSIVVQSGAAIYLMRHTKKFKNASGEAFKKYAQRLSSMAKKLDTLDDDQNFQIAVINIKNPKKMVRAGKAIHLTYKINKPGAVERKHIFKSHVSIWLPESFLKKSQVPDFIKLTGADLRVSGKGIGS